MKIKHVVVVTALALAHDAAWWISAMFTAASVHDPEYWDGSTLVIILCFPLGWAPDSLYPGDLQYLMMALNSLLWAIFLYGIFLTLSHFRKRLLSSGGANV